MVDAPLEGVAPRVLSYRRYDQEAVFRIDPADFGTPLLAAQMADKWLEVGREIPGTGQFLPTVLRHFLRHITQQPHSPGDLSSFDLTNLRRRHLDAWENDLLARHREAKTEIYYRYAIHFFSLLRRIESDAPGTLHEEVRLRLERDSRLGIVRNPGLEAFSTQEIKKIRSAAYGRVNRALREGAEAVVGRDILISLHVLLSLATGEPPEVLRQLTITSITATALPEHDQATARMTHRDRLTWLAENDAVEQFAVTYVKHRAAGKADQEVYTRRSGAAHRGFSALLRLTAAVRQQVDRDALWLYRRPDGRITQPPWNGSSWSLAKWMRRHHIEIEGRVWWHRLRKVVISGEAARKGGAYLRKGRRHTPSVFFNHYTRSAVLRAEVGRLLLDEVEQRFNAAVNGPLVITPDAEELLATGQGAPNIRPDLASQLLDGELEGPHTACRDPLNSPYEKKAGNACSVSMTGTCFGCPNALITQAHLPAAVLIADIADPARAADPAVWSSHWRDIHHILTEVVLPAFPDEMVRAARDRAELVPIDLGTANDMRGAHADP